MQVKTKQVAMVGIPILAILALVAASSNGNSSAKDSNPSPTPTPSGSSYDERTAQKIAKLHPKMRANALRFIGAAKAKGINIFVTSSLRTFAEQTKLYNQGRTAPGGIVTNAKAGQSFHNYGLAIDVAVLKDGKIDWKTDWDVLGKLGKQNGLEWGGDFKSFVDRPHFQMKFGHTHQELKAMVDAGKTTNGYVNV